MPESVRREIHLTIYTSGFSKNVRPGIRACVPCNATARAPRIAQEHPCNAETLAMLEYCGHILRSGNAICPLHRAPVLISFGASVGRQIATWVRYTPVSRNIGAREIAAAETEMVRRQARSAEHRIRFVTPAWRPTASSS